MTQPSEERHKSKLVEVVRWLCVMPAAIIGSFVAEGLAGATIGMLIKWADRQGLIALNAESMALLMTLVIHLPKSIGFVLAGGFTAPRFKVQTAIVLAAIVIPLAFFVHVIGQYIAGNHVGTVNYAHGIGECLGAIIAIVCVAFWQRRSDAKLVKTDTDDD